MTTTIYVVSHEEAYAPCCSDHEGNERTVIDAAFTTEALAEAWVKEHGEPNYDYDITETEVRG